MCLVSKQFIPKIAKEDIKCFKVLKVISNAKGIEIRTPITKKKIPLNKIMNTEKELQYTLRSEIFPIFGKKCSYLPGSYEIGKGYIHTYATEIFVDNSTDIICECIIPKGTLYFTSSVTSPVTSALASKKIKFLKFLYKDDYWKIENQSGQVKIEHINKPLNISGSYEVCG